MSRLRRWMVGLAVAAAVVVIGVEIHFLFSYRDLPWRRHAVINVRWAPPVADQERAQLEGALGLRVIAPAGERTWSYRVDDPGSTQAGRIVGHPAVEDTAYIDRSAKAFERYRGDPPPPVPVPLHRLRIGMWVLLLAAAVAAADVPGRIVRLLRAPAVAAVLPIATVAAAVATRFGRQRQSTQGVAMFLLGLLPLTGASIALDLPHPEWRTDTIYQRGVPLLSSDEFLSQDPDLVDHDVYYHGLYGWVEHARRADVIFTGNSRAVYAFRRESLKPEFDRLGLSYYSLAFAGGADAFPLELMRRYDLRPKVLVVNVHGFFDDDLTRFGVAAMGRDRFAGWNYVWERQASWTARSVLHRVVPHWPTEIVHRRGQQLIYRRISDGTWRWAMPLIDNKPMGSYPIARTGDADEDRSIEHWTTRQMTVAPGFIRELEARGTRVVLVYVPWNDAVAYYSAENLARRLGRPLLVAWPEPMISGSGSHMGEASSRRYIAALMPKLLDTDAFRSLIAERSAAR